MIIIPAIDLKDGRCVRLAQGDFNRITVYSNHPEGIAEKWAQQGAQRIHIVDLDGSVAGSPKNRKTIGSIIKSVRLPVQVGGGIRDISTIEDYLNMGVNWVIIGTKAMTDRDFVLRVCDLYRGKIILGLDAKDGKIAIQGWTEHTSTSLMETAKSYEKHGLAAIVYTDIKRDGMEVGVNVEATKALAEAVDIPVIASGGVSGLLDIERLMEIEKSGVIGVIVGKALYSGAISLKDAISISTRIKPYQAY